jgi:nicotinate-nucleotide--dimethylbenzimidazole phosphoribosyltransferase
MHTFNIQPLDRSLALALQNKIDGKTKPRGALGRLEELALQAGLIQQSTEPTITHPHLVVFAGDHGIAATGLVNPYPQEVTAQMVLNFVGGGAAINVFCKQNNILLTVVDAGVQAELDPALPILHAKVARGTRNYLTEAAMGPDQCEQAIWRGSQIVSGIHDQGCNCIGLGEMGIGNSSSAALIMSAVLRLPLADCVGRGTGATGDQLKMKMDTLQQAYEHHRKALVSPLEILRRFGGFEIAMMVGAYLRAAELRMIIVVDGFIATAALLIAQTLYPAVKDYCLFAHSSAEQGHQRLLHYLEAKPLLNLELRLGEGTGAALALPLLQSSLAFLNEMASFQSAAVSTL